MNRFKYTWKFLFISFFFIMPLFVAVYSLISSLNHDIQFAEKERLGVQYIISVKEFLQDVQQHRGMMSAYLNGDESFAAKIADKQREISANEEVINIVDVEIGAQLKTTNKWSEIKRQWSVVRAMTEQGTPLQSFQLHTELAKQIILLISHAGDTSNLILDPDLDTYYLMDSFLNRIPFISEWLGEARAFGLTLTPDEHISGVDKRFLSNLVAFSQYDFNKMEVGMDVAFSFNPSLQQSLQAHFDKVGNSVKSFIEFVESNIIDSDEYNINSVEYYNAATKTIDDVLSLHDSVSPNLDKLLKVRIDKFKLQKNIILAVILLMLVLVSYLFAGFYINMKNTIFSLQWITGRMLKGETGEEDIKFEIKSRDELAKIVESFNLIAKELSSSNVKLKSDIEKRIVVEDKLKARTEELQRINDFMVGRELKMAELKKVIVDLLEKLKKKD